jgi:hypothetical protein
MIDVTTNKPLRVLDNGTTLPMIELPFSQLDDVRRLLDGIGVRYWVDEEIISFNGGPEEALIVLGRGTDASAVQAALDSVP